MKLTVPFAEEQHERPRELAANLGCSQSEVVRRALSLYFAEASPVRQFAVVGCVALDGMSVAEMSEEELLEGFGEDSWGLSDS